MKILRFVVGPVATNCYFAINEATKETLIIDPGAEAKRLYDKLKENSLKPVAILITHGHFDHAGAVEELKEFCASDGNDVISYAYFEEERVLKEPALNLSRAMEGAPKSYEADNYVKDGDEIKLAGFSIKVIFTPGHTPGGCSFYMPDEGVLFSGDTLFCGSVGRSDFPEGSASTLIRSIKEKLLVLPDDTLVCPGHDSDTSIGDEKRYNPFLHY